jgi:hypothetical protein
MTVLVAIVLYVIALLVVLLLVGGVRRGDDLHQRALRSMRNASREPAETPRPEHYSSPWSKPPKDPARPAADARSRSAARS